MCTGTMVHHAQAVMQRMAIPERVMRRVRAGTPVHYAHVVTEGTSERARLLLGPTSGGTGLNNGVLFVTRGMDIRCSAATGGNPDCNRHVRTVGRTGGCAVVAGTCSTFLDRNLEPGK